MKTFGHWKNLLIWMCLPAIVLFGLQQSAFADLSPNASVIATGLNNPRGLKFGPDGHLYVAEAGLAGSNNSTACVPDPPSPFDPYVSGYTGQITKINPSTGQKTVVAEELPSTLDNTNTVLGPVDVAFVNNRLYACVCRMRTLF